MKNLTLQQFKENVFEYENERAWKFRGKTPTIIDFYADWCAPCRALTPILNELQEEYGNRIEILKVDTEAEPQLAGLFGIRSIPSLLFIPLEGEPSMASGFVPKEGLQKAIKDLLNVEVVQ